jgi:DNA polymerase III epsilon subunit-like protein
MNILFFDTETTGTPKNYKAPMQDLDNWPRIIQLAWEYADHTGTVHDSQKFLIKPDAWEIPKEKFWIENGFSTEQNQVEGRPMPDILDHFISHLDVCDVIVAHNFAFDYPITGAEMIRYKKKAKPNPQRAKVCTMETTVELCKIPFPNRGRFNSRQPYKWPKLNELYQVLFNKGFAGAHDAGNDVAACRECFFELLKKGHLPQSFYKHYKAFLT